MFAYIVRYTPKEYIKSPIRIRSQPVTMLFFDSERVEVELLCFVFVSRVIIILFNEHLVDHSDGEQIKVGKTETDLHTSEKEQRCRYLAVNWARFFFDSACVSRFTPQSSKSCGSTS